MVNSNGDRCTLFKALPALLVVSISCWLDHKDGSVGCWNIFICVQIGISFTGLICKFLPGANEKVFKWFTAWSPFSVKPCEKICCKKDTKLLIYNLFMWKKFSANNNDNKQCFALNALEKKKVHLYEPYLDFLKITWGPNP